MSEAIYRFVIKEVYSKLLRELNREKFKSKPLNIYQSAQEIGMTYAHLTRVLNFFVSEGIMASENEGRQVKISLTPKGKKIADLLSQIDGVVYGN